MRSNGPLAVTQETGGIAYMLLSLGSQPGSPSVGVSQVTFGSMGRSEGCGDRDESSSPILDICSSTFPFFPLLPHCPGTDFPHNSLTSPRSRCGPTWFLQRPLPLDSRRLSSCRVLPGLFPCVCTCGVSECLSSLEECQSDWIRVRSKDLILI